MAEGLRRQNAAARRALNVTVLNQIGLDDLLDRIPQLGERRGNRFNSDRPAAEIDSDLHEIAPIELIKTGRIHFELRQSPVGDGGIDRILAGDEGEVTDPPQQAAGDTW